MSDPYRDPLAGLRDQVQLLQAQVRALQRSFTAAIWPCLPGPLAVRIESLALDPDRRPAETYEALRQELEALEAYLAALKEARDLAPALEQELRALPAEAPGLPLPPPPPPPPPPLFAPPITALQPYWDIIARLDPQLRIPTLGKTFAHLFYAFFRWADAPFVVSCWLDVTTNLVPSIFRVQLGTSVPLGFPPLRLRPEGLLHSLLLKPLGLVKEAEVGKLSFDGQFLIEAAPAAVELLLSEEIQRDLVELARYDVPRLEVTAGSAHLSWSYGPDQQLMEIGLRVLAALRNRPVRVQLLCEQSPEE